MRWDDGTPFNPPKDPLKDKWDNLYPACKKGGEAWDYACMFCGKCPFGDHWKVPEEDKAVWKQYQADMEAYVNAHGGWEHLLLEINVDYKNLPEQGEEHED